VGWTQDIGLLAHLARFTAAWNRLDGRSLRLPCISTNELCDLIDVLSLSLG